MRTIIIVARGNGMTRVSYDSTTNKANAGDFTGKIPMTVLGATRMNGLALVNSTLRKLKEMKDAGTLELETTPTLIWTLGMITDMIDNGTFKYWLKNGGKKNDGTPVHADEVILWNEFAELYTELYMDVTFKNVAKATIPTGRTRYPITQEQRTIAGFAEKAWDRVKIQVPELEEESDGEAL